MMLRCELCFKAGDFRLQCFAGTEWWRSMFHTLAAGGFQESLKNIFGVYLHNVIGKYTFALPFWKEVVEKQNTRVS